mmetsp:Transcript_104740/g.184961  ORF Transcript_104740/g.184961 Transcript_104740/m.184961 type:complete len:467 (+) Transcript_104740:105-1505(+)
MRLFTFLLACTACASDANRIRAKAAGNEGVFDNQASLASFLLSSAPAVGAFLPSNVPSRRAGVKMGPQLPNKREQAMKASRRDVLGLALLLAAPFSARSADVSFQQEAVIFADSLIPLVRELKAKEVAPLAGKSVSAAVTGDPKEIVKTIDLALDAFLSIPPERFFVAAKILKEGTAAAAQSESCNLVCLPPKEKTEQVARAIANEVSLADPIKLQTFLKQIGVSFKSGDPKAYAQATGDILKFSVALNKKDFLAAKDAWVALANSIDKAEPVKDPAELRLVNLYTRTGRVEVVSEELADALYPIVSSVTAKDVGPFASKLVELGATGDPKEIIKTIDAGLDAFLSVSPDRFFSAVGSLKEAIHEAVDAPKCNLICVAPQATVQRFARDASTALSLTDPEKLKVFVDQGLKSLGTGDPKQYAAAAIEGQKFLATLNPKEVQRVKTASLDLLKASGSELYTSFNWGV